MHQDDLRVIDRQIEALCSCGGDTSQLEIEKDEIRTCLADAIREEQEAQEELESSQEEWNNLHDLEAKLNEETARRIDNIPLGSMKDPGFWEKLAGTIADIFKAVGNFLWKNLDVIYEVLGVVLFVLTIVALCVVSLGTALPILIVAVAAVKLAIGVALWASGRISGWYVVLDALAVVCSVGSLVATKAAIELLSITAGHSARGVILASTRAARAFSVVSLIVDPTTWKLIGFNARVMDNITKVGLPLWPHLAGPMVGVGLNNILRGFVYTSPIIFPTISPFDFKTKLPAQAFDRALDHFYFEASEALTGFDQPVKDGGQPVLIPCGLEN